MNFVLYTRNLYQNHSKTRNFVLKRMNFAALYKGLKKQAAEAAERAAAVNEVELAPVLMAAKEAALIAAAELKQQLAAQAVDRRASEIPEALLDARAELQVCESVVAVQEEALAEIRRIEQQKQEALRRRAQGEKRKRLAKVQMAGAVEAFLKNPIYGGFRGQANALVAKCERVAEYQGLDPLLLLFEGLGGLAEREARDGYAKEQRVEWMEVADRRTKREGLAEARRSLEFAEHDRRLAQRQKMEIETEERESRVARVGIMWSVARQVVDDLVDRVVQREEDGRRKPLPLFGANAAKRKQIARGLLGEMLEDVEGVLGVGEMVAKQVVGAAIHNAVQDFRVVDPGGGSIKAKPAVRFDPQRPEVVTIGSRDAPRSHGDQQRKQAWAAAKGVGPKTPPGASVSPAGRRKRNSKKELAEWAAKRLEQKQNGVVLRERRGRQTDERKMRVADHLLAPAALQRQAKAAEVRKRRGSDPVKDRWAVAASPNMTTKAALEARAERQRKLRATQAQQRQATQLPPQIKRSSSSEAAGKRRAKLLGAAATYVDEEVVEAFLEQHIASYRKPGPRQSGRYKVLKAQCEALAQRTGADPQRLLYEGLTDEYGRDPREWWAAQRTVELSHVLAGEVVKVAAAQIQMQSTAAGAKKTTKRDGGGAQEAFRKAAVSVAPSLLVDAASGTQRGSQQRWVTGPAMVALENKMVLQRSLEAGPRGLALAPGAGPAEAGSPGTWPEVFAAAGRGEP